MAQAYDFALEKVGLDMNAHSIYNDYVSFLKSVYVFSEMSKFITKITLVFVSNTY